VSFSRALHSLLKCVITGIFLYLVVAVVPFAFASSATTDLTVTISPNPNFDNRTFKPFTLTVEPSTQIASKQLVFTSAPIKLEDDALYANLPCRFNFNTPKQTAVYIDTTTNSAGICTFDTQNTTITPNQLQTSQANVHPTATATGNIADINSTAGNGAVVLEIIKPWRTYRSNTVTYTITPNSTILVPALNITAQVAPGGVLIITSDPFKYGTGQAAANLPVELTIKTPNGQTIVLKVYTKADGTISFRSDQSLDTQNATLISGSLANLTTYVGSGKITAKINYNNASYQSPEYTYQVSPPVNPTPPPVPRTGGGINVQGLMAFVGLALVGLVVLIWLCLRGNDHKKPPIELR
jgi:hypothetical protein